MDEILRKKVIVKGIVQGVGFRPFVYRLADRYALFGKVYNNPQGVIIEIEGTSSSTKMFLKALREEAPPFATIMDIHTESMEIKREKRFEIVSSEEEEEKKTLISPDIAVCEDCLRELFDPEDRRYRYPFINCTNCGPRFTIIKKIPYDRHHTSMAIFQMCPDCQAEYEDPLNRRFHAQPNACSQCGPGVWLADSKGKKIPSADPIRRAAFFLKEGKIVAIKGIGGFHLAVDAENGLSIRQLRKRKQREEKPFAIMSESLEKIREFAFLDDEEKKLLSSFQSPITLLRRKRKSRISKEVAPGNTHLGVMLPYTPLHHLLFKSGYDFLAIVMTSGNLSDEPIAIENEEALSRLSGIADYFLLHNRDILHRSDDSVMLRVSGRNQFIRRSRGFVPVPILLKKEYPSVLAYGAELKNSICLIKGRYAFLSQHIGDLENMEAFKFFNEASRHLQRILDISPVAIACDLHPEYLNTKLAKEQADGLTLVEVQHHHAHIASCLAENGEEGPILGLSMDGLGYGTDETIWGGEFLYADFYGFLRIGSFKKVPMPGGASAIREPWRMAVSYLYEAFGEEIFRLKIPFLKKLKRPLLRTIIAMIQQKINAPLTSSLGRIFDAVSALLQIRSRVRYEGQAAMELEMIIDPSRTNGPPYPYTLLEEGTSSRLDRIDPSSEAHKSSDSYQFLRNGPLDKFLEERTHGPARIKYPYSESKRSRLAPFSLNVPIYIVDMKDVIRGIVRDIEAGIHLGEISAKFHKTIISIMLSTCSRLREAWRLDRVALSGGIFQNKYLFEKLVIELKQRGFDVLTHSKIPANDGGIALGQAIIAASLLNRPS